MTLNTPMPLAATPASAVLLAGDGRKVRLAMTDGHNLRIFGTESFD